MIVGRQMIFVGGWLGLKFIAGRAMGHDLLNGPINDGGDLRVDSRLERIRMVLLSCNEV